MCRFRAKQSTADFHLFLVDDRFNIHHRGIVYHLQKLYFDPGWCLYSSDARFVEADGIGSVWRTCGKYAFDWISPISPWMHLQYRTIGQVHPGENHDLVPDFQSIHGIGVLRLDLNPGPRSGFALLARALADFFETRPDNPYRADFKGRGGHLSFIIWHWSQVFAGCLPVEICANSLYELLDIFRV